MNTKEVNIKFPEPFKKLAQDAFIKSEKYYNKDENKQKPNPYYIGFGNPNSSILIIGQEKAFESKTQKDIDQLIAESINNVSQWKKLIDDNKTNIDFKFDLAFEYFYNPIHPYKHKQEANKQGSTWFYYEKLISSLLEKLPNTGVNNSFLLNTFITELNSSVSKRSLGYQENEERKLLLKSEYYRNFKCIILAAGTYLDNNEIEELFDVKRVSNESKPRELFVLYQSKDNKRKLIQVRQLSNGVKTDYLKKISEEVKKKN